MAVSAVSAGATPQDNPYAQVRQAFNQLSNALQSGNLTAAQSAYNTLESSPIAQNGPLAQALQQIGQDLQSGDISGAQQALSQLQQQQPAHHAPPSLSPSPSGSFELDWLALLDCVWFAASD